MRHGEQYCTPPCPGLLHSPTALAPAPLRPSETPSRERLHATNDRDEHALWGEVKTPHLDTYLRYLERPHGREEAGEVGSVLMMDGKAHLLGNVQVSLSEVGTSYRSISGLRERTPQVHRVPSIRH